MMKKLAIFVCMGMTLFLAACAPTPNGGGYPYYGNYNGAYYAPYGYPYYGYPYYGYPYAGPYHHDRERDWRHGAGPGNRPAPAATPQSRPTGGASHSPHQH